MRLTCEEVARATGGSFAVEPRAGRVVSGISWDSRAIKPGDAYLCIPGQRVDGHDFACAALRAGAACVIASHGLDPQTDAEARACGAAVVRVQDATQAMTDLARAWRERLTGKVIGITGSTGKTTTKNLVRDVLSHAGSVAATIGNQNNELGVPNTLLSADESTDFVVVEAGMRGLGQLAALCEFVRPSWGIVTNVGESHIELLGSRENIARAKSELLAALPTGGVAFVNAACDLEPELLAFSGVADHGVSVVLFSSEGQPAQSGPAVWAERVSLDDEGRPSFMLCARGFGAQGGLSAGAPAQSVPCSLALRGVHNVSNACSAAAVGLAAGLSLDACARALAASQPETGRQEVVRASCGAVVVNDAYNANPDSMRASLSTFCALSVSGRRIAVLGDMGELGDFAPACHRRVGAYAGGLPLDALVCVGPLSRNIALAAQEAGMSASGIVCVDTWEEALAAVRPGLTARDAVLVKASHYMGLERVVEGLVA